MTKNENLIDQNAFIFDSSMKIKARKFCDKTYSSHKNGVFLLQLLYHYHQLAICFMICISNRYLSPISGDYEIYLLVYTYISS